MPRKKTDNKKAPADPDPEEDSPETELDRMSHDYKEEDSDSNQDLDDHPGAVPVPQREGQTRVNLSQRIFKVILSSTSNFPSSYRL